MSDAGSHYKPSECRRILEAARRAGPAHELGVLLEAQAGLEPEDVQRMKVRMLDLRELMVRIPASVAGRPFDVERAMGESLVRCAAALVSKRSDRSDPLEVAFRNWLSTRTRILLSAGVRYLPMGLRAGYCLYALTRATNLLKNGTPWSEPALSSATFVKYGAAAISESRAWFDL